jgi:S1-C subfamily serine protease
MVILAGSGHLQHSWGIPARVQRLTHDTSALILNDSGQGVERGLADFILFPEPVPAPESLRLQVMLQKEKEGVIIEKVMKDGPGEKAGLKEKDIIKKVDNRAVSDIDDIKIHLLMKNRGDTVNVTVLRKKQDGKMEELILKVGL